ncbi:MAG: biotin transporter BioY [Neisseriaceae bacterium]|nr:biotin transporter BioY [Neisseriaceae bacterium]
MTLSASSLTLTSKLAEKSQGVSIVFGLFLLTFSAQLSIPLQPVPLTFQSAMVVLLGLSMGSRLAMKTVLAYLMLGFAGLPLFSNYTGGLQVLTTPIAGYLLGFFFAAGLAGWLAERGFAHHAVSLFLAALLSVSVIFACGVLILQTFVGWQVAYQVGVLPFVVSEPIKLMFVALAAKSLWQSK